MNQKIDYYRRKQSGICIGEIENQYIELLYKGKKTKFPVVCKFFMNMEIKGCYLVLEVDKELILVKWNYENELVEYITDDKEWYLANRTYESILAQAQKL